MRPRAAKKAEGDLRAAPAVPPNASRSRTHRVAQQAAPRERAADRRREEIGRPKRIAAVKLQEVPERLEPPEIMALPTEPPPRIVADRKLPVRTTPQRELPSPIAEAHRPRAQTMRRQVQQLQIVAARKHPVPKTLLPALRSRIVINRNTRVRKAPRRVRRWPIATSRSIPAPQVSPRVRPPFVARTPIPCFTASSGTARILKCGPRAV